MPDTRLRAAMALAPALAVACGVVDVENQDYQAVAPFSFEVPLADQRLVRLDAMNGPITVTGDPDATSITIAGERRVRSESVADASAHLDDLQVRVVDRANETLVETVQPTSTGGRGYEVAYQLVVPGHLALDLHSVNGAIEVRFVNGDIVVQHVNGDISLVGTMGPVVVAVVNGRIDAAFAPAGDPSVDLSTVNGSIDVTVPTTASCLLVAEVVNGNITVSNLTLTDVTQTRTTLRGTLGDGAGTMWLQTVNGNIRIAGR